MAFYYVKSGLGTRVSGSSTEQSGAFGSTGLEAPDVYASIPLAITGGATSADLICCSDLHAHSTSSALTYVGGTTQDIHVESVDNGAADTYKKGASETVTGGASDMFWTGLISFTGVSITSEDQIRCNTSGSCLTVNDATVRIVGSENTLYFGANNVTVKLFNTNLEFSLNNGYILMAYGSLFEMWGGAITSDTGEIKDLFKGGFSAGGGTIRINGTDLSDITGTTSYVIGAVGNSRLADDIINIAIDKCVMGSYTAIAEETLAGPQHNITVTQSSSSSATAEYQYLNEQRGGTVEQATNIWRDESTTFLDSAQKVSLHCITDSNATQSSPYVFDFPSRVAALSAAATDVIEIYLCTDDAVDLYDDDVWAELIYPDGTTKNVFNKVNSLDTPANIPNSIARTPAILPTDSSSTWEDSGGNLVGYNEYVIKLDTSADVGADCVPKIRMHVAITLAAGIYFDTSLGVVSS